MNIKLLLSGVIVVIIIGLAILTREARQVSFNQGHEPQQPIAFSHKIHAGQNKIACMYCHFAADKGRHAGIPPTSLCMNCHSQIKKDSPEVKKIADALEKKKNVEWIKVHQFPDFAYFNHSQHVRVGKVSCQKCHGPVETMERVRQHETLNMGWCISCHRDAEIAPPKDHKSKAGGDCARCHY